MFPSCVAPNMLLALFQRNWPTRKRQHSNSSKNSPAHLLGWKSEKNENRAALPRETGPFKGLQLTLTDPLSLVHTWVEQSNQAPQRGALSPPALAAGGAAL